MDHVIDNRINEIFFPEYYTYWNNSIEKKGYSGVSIMTKIKPKNFKYGIDSDKNDTEGRVITLEFDDFYLVAVYVPNSGEGLKRLLYRVDEWDKQFLKYLARIKKKKNVIVTGDFNVAHRDIDIYDPFGKDKQPGFTPQERQSFQGLLDTGFTDTYRHLYPDKQEFTFWANRAKSRVNNKGWRLDYFLVNNQMQYKQDIHDSSILTNYTGSDHCPIKLILK